MKFFILFTLLNASCFDILAQCPILPTPFDFRPNNEDIRFQKLVITTNNLSEDELLVFNEFLKIKNLKLETGELKTQNIVFSQFLIGGPNDNKSGENDGYSILIDKNLIEIAYTTQASKMYAFLSVIQLIEADGDEFVIRGVDVFDYAKFEWRGLHLDVARHFFTVDEVKRYIDLMAFYKFNRFHWHLTDDQGWRIEIKKYPKLTEIGAFRDSTLNGHYNQVPRKYDVERTGGFYTQEEIKDVVAYAKKRHVEIVPEIEMPGHARAALAAYPELSCTGKQQFVVGLWGVFDDIFCSKPETSAFLRDVLDEIVPLFPYEFIHIGGDEAPKNRWKTCAKCQKTISENELKDEHELQTYFIQQMDDFLTSKGKKIIGWDEILEGGLSTNAAVMSWRGEEGGVDAANQDHYVVMSPTTYCYFDYYQSGDDSEPISIGGFLPLEKVYEYSPIPKDLAQDKQKYILGGQANLWTEYISTLSQVEYMVYPRAIALMQSLWCAKKPSYADFLSTFQKYHEPILQKLKVNYSKSVYLPKLQIDRSDEKVRYSFQGINGKDDFHLSSNLTAKFSDKGYSAVGENGASIIIGPSEDGREDKILIHMYDSTKTTLFKSLLVTQHNGLGLNITLETQPHEKYSHNSALTLSDGILGSRPWKGDQWLGFNEDSVVLILDIPKGKRINKITLSFLDAKGSWIYLPNKVDYYVLSRKGDWRKTQSHVVVSDHQSAFVDLKTKKLKIVVTPISKIPNGAEGAGNRPWIFMDEVILKYEK